MIISVGTNHHKTHKVRSEVSRKSLNRFRIFLLDPRGRLVLFLFYLRSFVRSFVHFSNKHCGHIEKIMLIICCRTGQEIKVEYFWGKYAACFQHFKCCRTNTHSCSVQRFVHFARHLFSRRSLSLHGLTREDLLFHYIRFFSHVSLKFSTWTSESKGYLKQKKYVKIAPEYVCYFNIKIREFSRETFHETRTPFFRPGPSEQGWTDRSRRVR